MGKKFAALLLVGAMILTMLVGCVDDSSYRKDLENGQRKYYSGEAMTKSEYNAVKNFNKWKANQGSKTYDDWGG